MDTASQGNRSARFTPSSERSGDPALDRARTAAATVPRTNSVTASQARAARRREARRDEQAVAAWLRELTGRAR